MGAFLPAWATRKAEENELREIFARLSLCDRCGLPVHNNARMHRDCQIPKEFESKQPAEVIERELQDTEPLSDDPWCPEVATGTCVNCGEGARPEWLLCDPCIEQSEALGGTSILAKVRRARKPIDTRAA